MKIVFILPGIGRSGGIRNSVVVANHLLARGHEVRIFYRNQPKTLRLILRSVRNKIIYSGRYSWFDTIKGSAISFRDITECKFASEEIIVAVGIWCSSELDRLEFIGNPKLQYLRGMTFWMPERMERALSLDVPKIVLSSRDRDYIKSRSRKTPVEVIPNAVDTGEYYPDCNKEGRTAIGTIYSSHPAKDPDTILASLAKLKQKLPDVPQYIFGAGRRPKEIPKANYVRLPSIHKARRLYSRCKVWILASRSEGFGMPILEAMACGCAVVATDCGGTRDIIKNTENGFLVEVGDVHAIVNRVKRLLEDPILRKTFVQKSQETVNKFNWETSINKLERVLLTVSQQYQD